MQTLSEIKALLESRGLAPRHALGQNFLIDKNLVAKLIDASGVKAGDTVLEVGPGTGTLTEGLLERGCRVVACELDAGLAALLRERIPALGFGDRFTLIEGDCLETGKRLASAAATALGDGPFSLVANLPYGAATPLMLNLLIERPNCSIMAVTIQKEVAERLMAAPASKDFGTLGVVTQAMAEVSLIATLPRECFWPRPDITSAMVLVRRRAHPATDRPDLLAAFCQRVFQQRRKQLGSTLGRAIPWPEGVTATMRAEELSVEQFVKLAALADSQLPG
ncbi:MAG: 16S rRNA (adenine(1518)-N(6)/adenine(1519)-N(6))-dimethyltransferase RsmA [Phycisphaerales bacterium]